MRRPGTALCWVMMFLLFASMILGELFSRLWWAQEAAAAGERRIRNGIALASLTERGRRWLQAELTAGRLPLNTRSVPKNFTDIRLLHHVEEGLTLDIYNLDYAPDRVPDTGWGPEGFFPPCAGAFLIRVSAAGEGMERRLETVVRLREREDGGATLEERPLLWQEVWP